MSETELENLPVEEPRKLHWDWLYQVILAPRKHGSITSQDKPTGLHPCLYQHPSLFLTGSSARLQAAGNRQSNG